jgi:hypothetical protein
MGETATGKCERKGRCSSLRKSSVLAKAGSGCDGRHLQGVRRRSALPRDTENHQRCAGDGVGKVRITGTSLCAMVTQWITTFRWTCTLGQKRRSNGSMAKGAHHFKGCTMPSWRGSTGTRHRIGVVTEKIDTFSTTGKLVFHVFAALAEYAEPAVMRSDAIEVEVWPARWPLGAPHNIQRYGPQRFRDCGEVRSKDWTVWPEPGAQAGLDLSWLKGPGLCVARQTDITFETVRNCAVFCTASSS